MTARELREKYLNFFKSKGHTIIPSASLIPEGTDPTALFITAGMHPLVPYLMGENHPGGGRLANIQKCVRTDDIDEVGDPTHNTFFEMMGNWSLGDYFKKESIEWSWEFLTSKEWLGLDPKRIAVSVFAGDADAPRDDEAAEIWLKVSNKQLEGRIDYLPKAKNWWGPAGVTGPCGPDTEIFYWTGESSAPEEITAGDLADHSYWVEIWNNVFMQYNKKSNGKYEPLKQMNVDTGMGMERTLAIMNGFDDIYKTELFQDIILKIEGLSEKKYDSSAENTKAMRIIADHIRASAFITADGVIPSNTGSGYVSRRLIRRAVRYGKILGIPARNASHSDAGGENNFTKQIAEVVIEMYKNHYPELEENKNKIFEELEREENKFGKTLEGGIKELKKIFNIAFGDVDPENPNGNIFKGNKIRVDGKIVFHVYETYGLPIEISQEIMTNWGLSFDEVTMKEAEEAFKKHQELSRTASAGMFKGGLADAGEATAKLHTATHLLLAALRQILGEDLPAGEAGIYQKGSNITAERLRFDFNYPQKLTAEQIKAVEDLVNQKIQENISVEMTEMPKDEALKIAKVSFDPSKYGDIVKVYKAGDFSVEVCGGPHAKTTGELGKFKITKEEASSAGIRRIKAVLQ